MTLRDDELWTLRYYGEPLTDEQRRRFTDDLEFRRGYEAFRRQMDWIDRHAGDPAAEPSQRADPDLADRIWRDLRPELRRESAPTPFGRRNLWKPVAGVLALAASLLLVFLVGVRVGNDEAALTAEQRQRVLDDTMERHLRRSGDLLTELTNLSPAATGKDLSAERSRAEELASDNRLYRQSLGARGNSLTLDTLDRLETVLIELANLPENAEAAEILALRRRVQRLGLLLRLEMLNEVPDAATPSPGEDRAARGGDQV